MHIAQPPTLICSHCDEGIHNLKCGCSCAYVTEMKEKIRRRKEGVVLTDAEIARGKKDAYFSGSVYSREDHG